MGHPNEDLLRRAYADFARGDLDAYLSVCTDTIAFRVPGRSVVSGTSTRAQCASEMIAPVMTASNGSFREILIDIVANQRRDVVLAHHVFERNGRTHQYNMSHVYRIEDGRLTSFEEYPEDLYAFDAAWS